MYHHFLVAVGRAAPLTLPGRIFVQGVAPISKSVAPARTATRRRRIRQRASAIAAGSHFREDRLLGKRFGVATGG